jgi:hypothetical protein
MTIQGRFFMTCSTVVRHGVPALLCGGLILAPMITQRPFDEGRRKVRAWEAANVKAGR